MILRPAYELPHREHVPALAGLLGDRPGEGMPAAVGDPGGLVDAALAHGLEASLARALDAGAVELPPDQRRRLGRACAMRLARARALRRELDELAPHLTEACGAPPLCLKGPAVADRLYEEGGRLFGDLDLLVPRARLRAAAEAAIGAGWVEDVEFSRGFAERFGHELHLRRRRGGVWLLAELHWRVGDDPLCERLDHDLLATGASPLAAHPGALSPPPEAELLVLCVHFLGDRERRLIWIEDIRRAASGASERQWRRSFELADRLGLGWALHRGLDYAERHLGLRRARPAPAPPPPPFGPLRAVEELEMRASLHVGRLAALRGSERLRYARTILVPTAEGLRGTAGRDGVPAWRATLRHLRSALAGLRARR